jgi:restriction endonuclease Mrr
MDTPGDGIQALIRRLAQDHKRISQLTGQQLESVTAQILAQNAQAVEISRQLAPQVDLILTVRDNLQGLQRIAIECKATAQRLVDVAAVELLKARMEAAKASRAILITTSSFTEQARRAAEAISSTLQLVDRSGFVRWIEVYEKQQAELAAALAFQIQHLPLREIGRVEDRNLESLVSDDHFDPIIVPPYRERIVRVDRLPWRLLRAISQDPRHLYQLTPRQFEEFIAEVLDVLGFRDIILTPAISDGGRDVIASQRVNGIPLTFYFECKKYAPDNKVQLDRLRALLGVVAHNSTEANIGVLVTTSTFTAGAKKLIMSECRLDGKDYNGIMGWISDAKGRIHER